MPARVSSIVALLVTLAFAAACGRPAPDRAASTDTAAVETAWRDSAALPATPVAASSRDPDACTLNRSVPPKPPHDTAIAFADLREDVRGVRGFTCRLRGDSHLRVETVGDDEWNRVDELRIYPRDRLPLQVLKASDESGAPPRGSDYLTAPDLDGDGWSDLMLVKWSGATGNTAHDVWLYRPGERRFVHD
ncbi:MAG TPA: hypothetical protein VFQ39_05160, partial [Longimicrobium sp.]|nr:hypothetical protein [Longimicrobium sp.]